MSWSVKVDQDACLGSGICAGSRPDIFGFHGTHAVAVTERIDPDEDLLDLADTCPAAAILIRDGSGAELAPRP
ncbi:ferredoxin [Actinokineospora diospyrosa]|uniref:Ferredoxin n=1 Tax=Actinokineospora diospyrosa TaxID=103728 RepID=A0ABT1IF57_9PSEU|nr:ferredoxin [Actinokineospora diospyrosa]MCP2271245.1 ferredoxin [Actinokineospora diospyrosa]